MRAIEATESLDALLAELDKGEPLEIRRDNRPVALLIQLPSPDRRQRIKEAVQQIKELRKGVTLGGLNLKDIINEGRRF